MNMLSPKRMLAVISHSGSGLEFPFADWSTNHFQHLDFEQSPWPIRQAEVSTQLVSVRHQLSNFLCKKKKSIHASFFFTHMETDTDTLKRSKMLSLPQLQSMEQCWYWVLILISQLHNFGRINMGWSWEGVHATSLLVPSGKKPPLWDDLITGKEGMVIRGETGG